MTKSSPHINGELLESLLWIIIASGFTAGIAACLFFAVTFPAS